MPRSVKIGFFMKTLMKNIYFVKVVIVICSIAVFLCSCKKKNELFAQELFSVAHGNLEVTVVESGTLETLVSNDIVQNIRRMVKILEIVDEGTMITDEDVESERVLVRFETKDIEDQLFEQNTAFENAQSSFIQAEENLAIQISDNESSLRAAELSVVYADNDLRKLVGDKMAERFATHEKPDDILALLEDPDLGGQARQDLINLRGDIELAQIRLNRAEQKLEYTKKLFDKQFVSKNELETDELEVESQKKTLVTAKGKYDIFCRYDFLANFHRVWATLLNSRDNLVRTRSVNRARLVSREAVLRSSKQNLSRATTRLKEAQEALENCTIRATAPGLVVYETPPRWMNTGPIRSGVETRHRQTIIKLPDLNQMAVKVNIHESQIDLVSLDMPAIISVDAMPNRTFTGKVCKKALLPSSQNQWLTPDVKVYETFVAFDASDPDLRPGMNASVEIIAERINDVLYIPSQSVRTDSKGQHFCFKQNGNPVSVDLGKRNQSFVVVLSGLERGEKILMAPPPLQESSELEQDTNLGQLLDEQKKKAKEKALKKAEEKTAEKDKKEDEKTAEKEKQEDEKKD